MNSRFIPILVFVGWSLLSWRWYVCGIKDQCQPQDSAAANAVTPLTPSPSTIDTAGQYAAQLAIQAADNATNSITENTQKELDTNRETAQVVAVANHVLIHFPYNSARRIDDDAIDTYLNGLAKALVQTGGKVTLTGHADGIGDKAYNKAMSRERANHIRNALIKKGVAASQITVVSKGETKPIATNDNPRGRFKNRRVEISLK